MIQKMYTIYDKIAQEAGPIYTAKNHGIAFRQKRQAIAQAEIKEDFDLLYLGDFETETMLITPNKTPIHIDFDEFGGSSNG